MKYIAEFRDGESVRGVYLCKSKKTALTKAGKDYFDVIIADKTGEISMKVWDVNGPGIREFEAGDFIEVAVGVSTYLGNLQTKADAVRVAEEGEYVLSDYVKTTKYNVDEMYSELLGFVDSVKNPYLNKLLSLFFKEDEALAAAFKECSAAKTMHHAFAGGLLQHSLSVTRHCAYFATQYEMINRDLLITAALLHDVAKTKELSRMPANDYTDEGNLLGHIVMGVEMIGERVRLIPGFPETLSNELKHCIVAHHGQLEYGSPKRPALMEAIALNFADDADAKLQAITDIFEDPKYAANNGWLPKQFMFESIIRKTQGQD